MQCAKMLTIVLMHKCWKNVSIDLVSNRKSSPMNLKNIHTSCTMYEFHEYDKRSGYDTGLDIAGTRIERIRLGFQQLKKEIKLWKDEIKELMEADPIMDYRAGMQILIYTFYSTCTNYKLTLHYQHLFF